MKNRILVLCGALMIALMPVMAFAAEKEAPKPALYATGWAVLPPLIAIALALITKEV